MLIKKLFIPILAPIVQNRPLSVAIIGAASLLEILTWAGLPGWQCPLLSVLGIPCPGCGLTRAIAALLHGDWHQGLTLHAFAPFMMLALVLIGSGLLPSNINQKLVTTIEVVERQTGIVAISLIGLVLYWLFRLIFLHKTFLHLVTQ